MIGVVYGSFPIDEVLISLMCKGEAKRRAVYYAQRIEVAGVLCAEKLSMWAAHSDLCRSFVTSILESSIVAEIDFTSNWKLTEELVALIVCEGGTSTFILHEKNASRYALEIDIVYKEFIVGCARFNR